MKISILVIFALVGQLKGASITVANRQSIASSTNRNLCTPELIQTLDNSAKRLEDTALELEKKANEFDSLFGSGQGDAFRRNAETLRLTARNTRSSMPQCKVNAREVTLNPPKTPSTSSSLGENAVQDSKASVIGIGNKDNVIAHNVSAQFPTSSIPVNTNAQSQANITMVNTASNKTGNTRSDIFSQGNRMFTCSSGYLEVCEGNDSSKCIWKVGNAQDLTQFRLGMEESAKSAEKSAQEFDKAFGPNRGDSFRQNAKSIRSKAETCQVK
jgi:hypothetical protein